METNTIDRYEYDENTSRRPKPKSCNSQICFAYFLSVIASGVIVSGVYLSYIRWDKVWLILSILGILLILIGSCFYYSGNVDLFHANEEQIYENRPRRRRRYRNRGLSTDQLMPSAPPLSQSRSVSQFSLNMIPQYFSSNESEAIQMNATNTPPVPQLKTFSQIFSVNGQNYLILPLSGEPLPASNNSFPLQNIVLKVSEDNKLKTSKNSDNCNEVRAETESKKINREEQSCQTDDFPEDVRKSNCFRDVQLQTLTRAQLEQTSNELTDNISQNSRLKTKIESTNVQILNRSECNSIVEIIPSAGPSHLHSNESQAYSLESSESSYSSADTESDRLNLESELVNNISLIDFNDNACTSSEFICRTNNNSDVQNEQNLLNSSINEIEIRAEDYVESECFNSFSNENVNEEEIDDRLSTPPPSYEDVIDVNENDNNEETPIIIDYGTL